MHSNSATETHVAGLFEGAGDDAKSVMEFLKFPVEQLRRLIATKEITLTVNGEDRTVPLEVKLGGDGKYIASALMHQGASAMFGCHFCECPTTSFMETNPVELKKFDQRTLQKIKEYAHMVPDVTCEGCGLKVVKTQQEADRLNAGLSKRNWRAIKVCTGDLSVDTPIPWCTKDGLTWAQHHKSIKYGGDGWYLVWNAELECWVTCFLHARLRLTALVFAVGVTNWLDVGWKPSKADKKAGVTDGPEVAMVTALMNAMLSGRKVKNLKTQKKTLTGRKISGSHAGLLVQNFDGEVCRLILATSEELLKVPFSEEKCKRSSSTAANKKLCQELFSTFKSFLAICAKPLEYPEGYTETQNQNVRNLRADDVDQHGKAFVEALKVLHPTSRSWYVHWAARHSGDEVRRHGSFIHYAMDGLEAKHSKTKQIQFRLSNSIQGQRVKTVMTHYAQRDAAEEHAKVC